MCSCRCGAGPRGPGFVLRPDISRRVWCASNRSVVLVRRFRHSVRFWRPRGIRSPARRSSDGRIRSPRQRHAADLVETGLGIHRPEPEGVGVLWRRWRTAARGAAIRRSARMSKATPVSPISSSASNGFGSTTDAIVRTALNFVDTSDPDCSVEAAACCCRRSASIDRGYRYKRILAGNTLSSILGAGQN